MKAAVLPGLFDAGLPYTAPADAPRFDGPAYNPARDHARLGAQLTRIFALVRDGRWRTLAAIAAATGDPEASVSAQLRHLRKLRFGGHTVERRRVGGGYEYRVVE